MMKCANAMSLTKRFKTPLMLEKRILTPDGGGGSVEQWESVGTVWAQIITQSAKEGEHDGHLVMKRVHQIFMRPQPSIKATMRLVYGSKHYYITGYYLVSENAAQRFAPSSQRVLLCLCEEFDILLS